MAMRETRIKIVPMTNTQTRYYPQYKFLWFFWSDYQDHRHILDYGLFFTSLERAKEFIDEEIADYERQQKRKTNKPVKGAVEYIKYP